jgi:peptide/nickel transport system ATP-binding protein/oligopeptide transport system ATP-binding protein
MIKNNTNAGFDPTEANILEVKDLKVHFPIFGGIVKRPIGFVYAVDGVSFTIADGETLGLVGESGCGKSTVGRSILRLNEPTSGSIKLAGVDITHLSRKAVSPYRREMQFVFQDPYASLNPRLSAGAIVGEAIDNYGDESGRTKQNVVADLFQRVGLRPENHSKYPHEFSGGQRQRIGIARALALNPKLIVADEPVSALDVSVQAQVLNLLIDLQEDLGLSYLFISHDLAVVKHISHRIAVMYLGKIVEVTDRASLFSKPLHPYTEALLNAAPIPDPAATRNKAIVRGDVPSPSNPPSGCRFHTRCPYVEDQCFVDEPQLMEAVPNHLVACHLRHPSKN